MKSPMLSIVLGTLAAVAAARGAPAHQWTLTRAQWAGGNTAASIVALAPLRAAVRALDAHAGAKLAVVHNGGEDGVFWASDLEGWLVALGVPAARIVDRTGAVSADELRLELLPQDGGTGP